MSYREHIKRECHWDHPDTCRSCSLKATSPLEGERELDQRIHAVVGEIVKTRQSELEPMEDDPNWWELLLHFRKN